MISEMNSYSVIIINILLYILFLYFNYRSGYKGKNLIIIIAALFLLSSICTLLFYDTFLYQNLTEKRYAPFSLWAILYLFINFVIYSSPIQSYNMNGNGIDMPNLKYFNYTICCLGLISIVPFWENMKAVLGMNSVSLVDSYYDKISGDFNARKHLSSIGRICNGVILWFQYITPILFFYTLLYSKKKVYICLSFIAFINPVLLGILGGGRGALFQTFCVLLFNYILFYDHFSKRSKQYINIIGIVICLSITIVLIYITFSRAEGNFDFALQQIYRYLGEGFANFGEVGWYVQNHTNGHNVINGTGNTFISDLTDYFDSRDYEKLALVTKMRMYVYYTVFGDYYIDFGALGGILFNLLLACIFKYVTSGKENSISSIILLNLYARIGFSGIFCFVYMYRIDFILFTLLVVFLLRRLEKKNTCFIRIVN